jgi:hypothetical protein
MKQLLIACLALFAVTTQAGPIVFVDTTFDTNAVATAEGLADIQSAASPPDDLPVISVAVVVGATDVATAGALAALGFLSTSADVTGITGPTSGVGTSHFSGMFPRGGLMRLTVDFDVLGEFATGTGFSASSLIVTVTSGGATLIEDVLAASTERTFSFELPTGSTGLLDLLLVSEASAAGEAGGGTGGAFSLALVEFGAALPLPSTPLLVLVAIAAMAAVRRWSPGNARRERLVSS